MPGIAQLIVVAVLGAAHIAPLGGAAHQLLIQMVGAGPRVDDLGYLAMCVGLLLAMTAYFSVDLWEMGVDRKSVV